jgi:hypothetical protein
MRMHRAADLSELPGESGLQRACGKPKVGSNIHADSDLRHHLRRTQRPCTLVQSRGRHPRYRSIPETARSRTAAVSTRGPSGTTGFPSTSLAWSWRRSPVSAWACSWNSGRSARSAWWTPVFRCRNCFLPGSFGRLTTRPGTATWFGGFSLGAGGQTRWGLPPWLPGPYRDG